MKSTEIFGLFDCITLMLKAFGVVLIAHICARICKECKSPTLADAITLAARAELIALCLPHVIEIVRAACSLI